MLMNYTIQYPLFEVFILTFRLSKTSRTLINLLSDSIRDVLEEISCFSCFPMLIHLAIILKSSQLENSPPQLFYRLEI